MKSPQRILVLLSLSLLPVQSFRSFRAPGRIGARVPTSTHGLVPRDSNAEPTDEPILLPPADYSKPGRVVYLVSLGGSVSSQAVFPSPRLHVTGVQGVPPLSNVPPFLGRNLGDTTTLHSGVPTRWFVCGATPVSTNNLCAPRRTSIFLDLVTREHAHLKIERNRLTHKMLIPPRTCVFDHVRGFSTSI